MISAGFKAFVLGATAILSVACGAGGSAPATPETPAASGTAMAPAAPAKPAPAAAKGAAAPNACTAAHGTCIPMTAMVACKSAPAGLCGEGETCCVM